MNISLLPYHIRKWYDPEYCLQQIKVNPYLIRFVKNQTEEIQRHVIMQDGTLLRYITTQTFELIEEALKQDIDMELHIIDRIDFSILTDEQYNYLKLKYDICS